MNCSECDYGHLIECPCCERMIVICTEEDTPVALDEQYWDSSIGCDGIG